MDYLHFPIPASIVIALFIGVEWLRTMVTQLKLVGEQRSSNLLMGAGGAFLVWLILLIGGFAYVASQGMQFASWGAICTLIPSILFVPVMIALRIGAAQAHGESVSRIVIATLYPTALFAISLTIALMEVMYANMGPLACLIAALCGIVGSALNTVAFLLALTASPVTDTEATTAK